MISAGKIKGIISDSGRLIAVICAFLFVLLLQSLYYAYKIPDNTHTELGLWCIFAYCGIAFALMMHAWKSERMNLNILFLLCLACIGILYIFIIGPIKAPDEKYHYLISYWYSNHLLGDFQDGLPMRITDEVFFEQWAQEYGSYAGQYSMLIAGDLPIDRSLDLYRDQFGISPQNSPLQTYFMASLGLTLGRLLGLNGLGAYYVGRIFQFAAFSACAYVALRNTPIGKPVFATIPLFPLVIEQASSFSYDAPIIGMASVLTAFCFKAIFEKQQQKRSTLIAIAVFSLLIVPCKVVYSVIVLLVIAIPASSFSSKRASYAYKAAVLLGCLIVFSITRLSNVAAMATGETTSANGEQWRGYAIGDLLADPSLILQLPFNTLFSYLSQYILQFCNASLGTLNLSPENSTLFSTAYFLLLLFALSKRDDAYVSSKLLNTICIGGFLAASTAIAASLLLGWTYFGSMRIEGIQGRYFYPLVFLLVPVFLNRELSFNSVSDRSMIAFCFGLDLLYSLNVYSFIALAVE